MHPIATPEHTAQQARPRDTLLEALRQPGTAPPPLLHQWQTAGRPPRASAVTPPLPIVAPPTRPPTPLLSPVSSVSSLSSQRPKNKESPKAVHFAPTPKEVEVAAAAASQPRMLPATFAAAGLQPAVLKALQPPRMMVLVGGVVRNFDVSRYTQQQQQQQRRQLAPFPLPPGFGN